MVADREAGSGLVHDVVRNGTIMWPPVSSRQARGGQSLHDVLELGHILEDIADTQRANDVNLPSGKVSKAGPV